MNRDTLGNTIVRTESGKNDLPDMVSEIILATNTKTKQTKGENNKEEVGKDILKTKIPSKHCSNEFPKVMDSKLGGRSPGSIFG